MLFQGLYWRCCGPCQFECRHGCTAGAALLPQVHAGIANVGAASTNAPMQAKTSSSRMEQTYIMIKPDGVQRGLVAEVIKR